MAQLIATLAIQLISNHYWQPKPEDRQTKKGEQIICPPWHYAAAKPPPAPSSPMQS
jgi:hypothetical protein